MLDSFSKQGIVWLFFPSLYDGGNKFSLNTVKPNFFAIIVLFNTSSSFIEVISSSETEAKQEAILFQVGCSEVNSTLLITNELTNQNSRKALFTCVVYTYAW